MAENVNFPARSVVVALPRRRTRVTVEAVRAVLAQLGAEASVRTVRDALGGGSLRDVGKALRSAKASIGERAREALVTRGEPAAEVLASAIAQFEDALEAQARERQHEVAALTREVARVRNVVQKLNLEAFETLLRSTLRDAIKNSAPAAAAVPIDPDGKIEGALESISLALRQRDSELPASLVRLQNDVAELLRLSVAPGQPPVDADMGRSDLLARLDGMEAQQAKLLSLLGELLTKPKKARRRSPRKRVVARATPRRAPPARRTAKKTKKNKPTRRAASKKVALPRRKSTARKAPVRARRNATKAPTRSTATTRKRPAAAKRPVARKSTKPATRRKPKVAARRKAPVARSKSSTQHRSPVRRPKPKKQR